ncbi:hypothetical protein MTP99_017961 [Tenebrio molitor]|nr:hypothetical protein MTP99_017961 [Tenebrio molitor]
MWLCLCPAVFLLGLLQEASPGPACRISEFPCRNGQCVRLNAYCDGSDDCGDLSDEPLYCTGKYFATHAHA